MTDFEEPTRFWSKVDVGEADECWEWLAYQGNDGYGRFSVQGDLRLAHRVAWFLTYGPIPKGLYICHHCDNRSCCNPYHLFPGTQVDNMVDAASKGRLTIKLSEEEVLEIRDLYDTGEWTQRELADEFGIHQSTLHGIVTRKRWKHLAQDELAINDAVPSELEVTIEVTK